MSRQWVSDEMVEMIAQANEGDPLAQSPSSRWAVGQLAEEVRARRESDLALRQAEP